MTNRRTRWYGDSVWWQALKTQNTISTLHLTVISKAVKQTFDFRSTSAVIKSAVPAQCWNEVWLPPSDAATHYVLKMAHGSPSSEQVLPRNWPSANQTKMWPLLHCQKTYNHKSLNLDRTSSAVGFWLIFVYRHFPEQKIFFAKKAW